MQRRKGIAVAAVLLLLAAAPVWARTEEKAEFSVWQLVERVFKLLAEKTGLEKLVAGDEGSGGGGPSTQSSGCLDPDGRPGTCVEGG